MAITLEAGQTAPAFELKDQDGNIHRLSDYAGKTVVLYFYPKDDTPGCTVEACSFRDNHQDLLDAGAVILGVSADDEDSHTKFREKFDLPFPLLADTETAVSQAYGVWGEKNMYGRKFMGINRATFMIGPDGTLTKIWKRVTPEGHGEDVLSSIKEQAAA
jgi:peroxiredoxin Q/BCP